MIHGISTFALCIAAAAVATVPLATPCYAVDVVYVSASGSGLVCSAAAPCPFLQDAVAAAANAARIVCLNGNASNDNIISSASNIVIEVDCPLGVVSLVEYFGTGGSMTLRHLSFKSVAGSAPEISYSGGGVLILDDCIFSGATANAVDIEPSAPLTVVIKNSRLSNNAAGILLKPTPGGSITATLDHVTITSNAGGGIKTDSTNGVVNLDITDSEISNNAGNGINLVGGAGGQNMLNLARTVIARNGAVGLQANGTAAGALVDTTLFDTNASGATTVVNSGHILTYGNNRIVGSAGSGFTGTASLQ
jgi:hypothetical protein